MAPVEQYLMDRVAEIALARSAAPDDISHDASEIVLTRHGYETAVEGKNGWVCWVGRGWMAMVVVGRWSDGHPRPGCGFFAASWHPTNRHLITCHPDRSSPTLTPVLLVHGLADEVLLLVDPILSGTGKSFVLNGQIIPSVTVWERIAMALEVPLANLFYDEEGVLLLGNREKPARCIVRTA